MHLLFNSLKLFKNINFTAEFKVSTSQTILKDEGVNYIVNCCHLWKFQNRKT